MQIRLEISKILRNAQSRCVFQSIFCIMTATAARYCASAIAKYWSRTLVQRIYVTVDAVKQGSTFRHASSIYRIPRSTLSEREARISANESGAHFSVKMGRPKTFTDEEEEIFVKILCYFSSFGFIGYAQPVHSSG